MRVYFRRVALVVFSIVVFSPMMQTKAQNLTQKFGEDSVTCVENWSLYREVFKQNNFKEAYTPWKWMVENCPMATKFIFTDGPVILDNLIANEKDSAKKQEYIQELFDLFDLRIKCYPPDEGYVLGRIGVYTMKYRESEYKSAREVMEKSIELSGKESSPQVLDIYFRTSEIYMVRERKLSTDVLNTDIMIDAYDKVTEVLDEMIDEGEIKLEKIMHEIYMLQEKLDSGEITSEEYFPTYEDRAKDSARAANELVQLRNVNNNMNIRFSKYATCDILIPMYAKKFEENKEDIRTLKQIVKFFTKTRDTACTNSNLFIAAVEELYKQTPTASVAFYMGSIKLKRGEYSEALSYFNQALDMYEKDADKINCYLLMAECYRHLKQYTTARETAYKILKLNPNDGRAYISVGTLYMSSVSSCATEVSGAAYWAAADKFSRAKTIDPTVAEDADKLLSQAAARFPKAEAYFNYGYSKGQPYRLDCWIGETTIIR